VTFTCFNVQKCIYFSHTACAAAPLFTLRQSPICSDWLAGQLCHDWSANNHGGGGLMPNNSKNTVSSILNVGSFLQELVRFINDLHEVDSSELY